AALCSEEQQFLLLLDKIENGEVYQRRRGPNTGHTEEHDVSHKAQEVSGQTGSSWRRIVLLILAITIHNIPEGLAVGVGFGAVGKTPSATFESARNLAIGIGIQNFPEGLAVSLPLRGSGLSTWRSFWYGQLSGMVEPLAGLLGAVAVVLAEPLLPYALAFAAGAMVYVVVDDIIPEAQVSGNGKLASCTSILGFIVMMSLDVGLG
uniref:Zinc transporter ZIP11 n=1 Tax=Cyprinus carpio TaxID=7962 RepID=A0A8C2BZX7_CYPCA